MNALKQSRIKQFRHPDNEEREVVYSQISYDMEKTRDMMQRSMSQASTISIEDQQMALMEKEFSMIKRKIDKIDHRLDELYKNWHIEDGNARTEEECKEIKNFYKPYLKKYESKYRMLYHLLQQPRLIPAQEDASEMTPSLAALDDATSLKQRDWLRRVPREDTSRQYSSIGGHLTPHTPGDDDMRLDPSLNITPEGLLIEIPTVVKKDSPELISEREAMGTSSKTAYMELPSIQVKTVLKETLSEISNPI